MDREYPAAKNVPVAFLDISRRKPRSADANWIVAEEFHIRFSTACTYHTSVNS
jgi:hypothetical protein